MGAACRARFGSLKDYEKCRVEPIAERRSRMQGMGNCAVLLLLAVLAVESHAAGNTRPGSVTAFRTAPHSPVSAKAALTVTRIRPDIHVISGAGANIVVQTGAQGVLIVDTGLAEAAEAVLAQVRQLSDRPIRYIFNTSGDAEHVGGNLVLARAGLAFGQSPSGPFAAPGIAPIVATRATLERLTNDDYDSDAWPTQTFQDRKVLYLNGQGIELTAKPGAHAGTDTVVLFRGSDVLVTGAIFDLTRFPYIDTQNGGTIQGEIAAMNDLIAMAIPNAPLTWLEGGTIVVPARGRAAQQAELVEYRDMLTIVRDRVAELKNRGKTLQEVVAANPSLGYNARYGTDSGALSTEKFIAAIYSSLTAATGEAH